MADEIKNQNVIQVWKTEDGWHGRIGPVALGLQTGPHETPIGALAALFREAASGGWIFDPTWQPNDVTGHAS